MHCTHLGTRSQLGFRYPHPQEYEIPEGQRMKEGSRKWRKRAAAAAVDAEAVAAA